LLIAAVLLTPRAAGAQDVPVASPSRGRVGAPDPAVRDRVGTAEQVTAHGFRLQGPGRERSLAAPFGRDTTLEAGRSQGASASGLLIGAGVGIVVGGAVGAYLDNRHLSTHGSLLPLTAGAGALVGGVLGAGGSAAWKGAGIGLLAGGGLGVIVGLAAGGSQNCDGSCAGLGALAFGGLGAGLGVVIGGIVGTVNRGGGPPEGTGDPVRLNVAPHGSGVAIGASVAF
jgi:hypothetical protein